MQNLYTRLVPTSNKHMLGLVFFSYSIIFQSFRGIFCEKKNNKNIIRFPRKHSLDYKRYTSSRIHAQSSRYETLEIF